MLRDRKFPNVIRVGRTAHLGEQGEVLLFVQPVERNYSRSCRNTDTTGRSTQTKDTFCSWVRDYTAHQAGVS
ncbi:hypothetical protein FRX31_008330 [Thalictrum thalictroides]|uniref:Uncharacterized protein n=1 Tax=Thalictrum thalictroides TaxID=46969 RepID=A0A7J6X0Z9_THATH|nr:hypothetical protein FRX31_008330 [Thalictrum thalictroides]